MFSHHCICMPFRNNACVLLTFLEVGDDTCHRFLASSPLQKRQWRWLLARQTQDFPLLLGLKQSNWADLGARMHCNADKSRAFRIGSLLMLVLKMGSFSCCLGGGKFAPLEIYPHRQKIVWDRLGEEPRRCLGKLLCVCVRERPRHQTRQTRSSPV